MNTAYTALAYAGNALSIILYVPQAYRAWRTKETKSLSDCFLTLRISVSLMNVVYAYGLVVTYGRDVGLPLAASQISHIILCSYLKYLKRNEQPDEQTIPLLVSPTPSESYMELP